LNPRQQSENRSRLTLSQLFTLIDVLKPNFFSQPRSPCYNPAMHSLEAEVLGAIAMGEPIDDALTQRLIGLIPPCFAGVLVEDVGAWNGRQNKANQNEPQTRLENQTYSRSLMAIFTASALAQTENVDP
jgi:hypothetical protein